MEDNPQNQRRKKLFLDLFQKEDAPMGAFETRKQELSAQEIEEETEILWARLQHEKATTLQQRPFLKRRYYSIAASLTICLLAYAAFLLLQAHSTVSFQTAYGETKFITLPDSSTLMLNANSKLTYPRNWDQETLREVWLEGEAYFQVQEKASPDSIKFIVHTQGLDVEVLGTQFNVRNRRHATEVVLNSGKVKLNVLGKEEIYMEPGDWVEYSVKTHVYERKQINAEKYTSWRRNVLTFEESTLEEIVTVLEDTYGLEITFKNPEIAVHRFTTTLSTDQIEILFPMLEESFNLKITQNARQIMIENAPNSP